MVRLSKSRIMSALQCPKKAWLEVHRNELAEHSSQTLAAFQAGDQVGAIAVELYREARGKGQYIEYEIGLAAAERTSRELMNGLFREPVFEATLSHDGVLVREDVLLPDGDSWRIVEVKASTSLKDQYAQDCAIQAWVHRGAGYGYSRISLAHVDNQFVYQGDGRYAGLLVEQDLTGTVDELLSSVPAWVDKARNAVSGDEPVYPVGQHCTSPYPCPFFRHCWPVDSDYPLHGLGGSKKKLGALVARGYQDILDVPASELDSDPHLRILRVTRSGAAEILPGAGEFMRNLEYPRFYFDFETFGRPVPVWPGTRPYQALPFQWSCHVEHEDGLLEHLEFLELDGGSPMRACAEAMIEGLGDHGPVIVYTTYEKHVIKNLQELYPDLEARLQLLLERIVDIAPPIKAAYYHPQMLGSWSLKAILPTIAPDLDYTRLEGVHEGTEASNAYLEAIDEKTTPQRREQIRQQLLEYCRYDTLAMVRLVHFFERH
ncbi:MAG: DUF2779 domain-containing protein [Xanthomonadales bacterium]|nr:DUF2779 domain-containing protein [Xanthomonadales bacterium]